MADERLKTFITVVKCGSLSEAARILHMSQPAISLQIQRLEEEYSARLLNRHERGVEPTAAGRILLRYGRRIHDLFHQAADEIAALTNALEGTLRVGATLTIGEYVLPPVMGVFKSEYPHADILLEVENTRRIIDAVAGGEFDCGFIEGPCENGLIRSQRLADDELTVVVSPHHPLAQKSQVQAVDLCQESFILREPGSGTRRVFEDAMRDAGIDPSSLNVLMQLGSTQAIKALVRENLGISVISGWTVREELRAGTLKSVSVSDLDLKREFRLIFKKNERLSLITRRFVQLFREQVCRR